MKNSQKIFIAWCIQIAAAMANLIWFALYPNWISLAAAGFCILISLFSFKWYREIRGYEHEA